jgi:ribosome-associated protein
MEALVVNEDLSIPLAEIELRASRSSGPGGQHANVTASRVEAVFDVASSTALTERQRDLLIARTGGRITASAQDTRSQAQNRELALDRLGRRIADALHVAAPRRPRSPSRAAEERRLERKRRTAARKRARQAPRAEDD